MTNYTEYNLWANETFVTWLKSKPFMLLKEEVPSSFSSIAKTLAHIGHTEVFWLSVLQGESLVFGEGFDDERDADIDVVPRQSARFADYVRSLAEEELLDLCKLDAPWMRGELPRYEFIQHCMNHSTYHRGQIITMGRSIGLYDPPMTDYNYYNLVVMRK